MLQCNYPRRRTLPPKKNVCELRNCHYGYWGIIVNGV